MTLVLGFQIVQYIDEIAYLRILRLAKKIEGKIGHIWEQQERARY